MLILFCGRFGRNGEFRVPAAILSLLPGQRWLCMLKMLNSDATIGVVGRLSEVPLPHPSSLVCLEVPTTVQASITLRQTARVVCSYEAWNPIAGYSWDAYVQYQRRIAHISPKNKNQRTKSGVPGGCAFTYGMLTMLASFVLFLGV